MKEKKRSYGFYSIKMRILGIVVLSVLFSTVLSVWTLVPMLKDSMLTTNRNYILDMTKSYGQMLELVYENAGDSMYEMGVLPNLLSNAGVEDVTSSYAYLVDNTGMMQYHPTPDKIGKPVENEVVTGLISEIKSGRHPDDAVVSYDFRGVTKFAGYYVSQDLRFILIITADESEILEPMYAMTRRCIMSAGIALVICAGIGLAGALWTVRPLAAIGSVIARLEHLDFTVDEEQEKLNRRRDETGAMSRAVTKLTERLAEVTGNLQQQSISLMAAAEALDRNAGETIRTVGQVEQAVGDIATGATSQANETQTATENVVAMGEMINKTSNEVEELNGKSKQIVASSEDAAVILGELGEINRKAVQAVGMISGQASATNESAQKIREATTLISSIAEETNLLSLNASIEAARAGDQGRGFAVVAAQIQKLAEQSNQSASQIEHIIEALLSDTTNAVHTMNEMQEIMGKQNEKMIGASDAFRKVKHEVDASVQSIGNIAHEAQNLQSARSSVVDIVQDLTAIAQENAASTEETSASVTEIASIIEDIANNASFLKEIAGELEHNMKQFKL